MTTFQNAGAAGQWFGAGSGAGDRWGTAPALVNAGSPNAANLHLSESDTVAKDAGFAIVPAIDDFDGDVRTAPWDIGADEAGGGSALRPSRDSSSLATSREFP